MFQGDACDLRSAMGAALVMARDLGHPRAGSEHLLLALSAADGAVSAILRRHGATEAAIRKAVCQAAPLGAGAADDRDTLAALGIDGDRLLSRLSPAALDRPIAGEPLLPLGAAKARRRWYRASPTLGLDAQAAYEASLRLALARRDRQHRPEHLALTLVALDPGADWALRAAGVNVTALLAELATAFPPPMRNVLLRAERRIGRRSRHHDLVRRYQRTTGRMVTSSGAVAALIAG